MMSWFFSWKESMFFSTTSYFICNDKTLENHWTPMNYDTFNLKSRDEVSPVFNTWGDILDLKRRKIQTNLKSKMKQKPNPKTWRAVSSGPMEIWSHWMLTCLQKVLFILRGSSQQQSHPFQGDNGAQFQVCPACNIHRFSPPPNLSWGTFPF